MMEFRADLHCHSTYSDGTLSPKELLLLAKERNLSGLSITDHDSIEAYSEDFFNLAKDLQIEILTGVEISSSIKDETVHILGYGFDWQSDILREFLKKIQKRRYQRNLKILEKLQKHGIAITKEDLYSGKDSLVTIGRPHIAKLMYERGYVKNFQVAFNLYLKDGGSCFVLGEKVAPDEIINKLHEVKAKAVLAHPQQLSGTRALNELLNLPFDGIEAYYGRLLPQQEMRWIKLAQKKGFLITGGSDFHGHLKPYLNLGCSWVSKDIFDQFKS